MTTSTQTLGQLSDHQGKVCFSLERLRRQIECFSRDNELCARRYCQELCEDLAQRGWFIAGSLSPSQYDPIAKALRHGHEHEVEEFLNAHVKDLIPGIRSRALKRWPNRAHILSDAFDAHNALKYTLSVPVFLAQADGISEELLGASLFMREGEKAKEKASHLIDDEQLSRRPLAKSFLGLLLRASGLGLSTRERNGRAASGQTFSPLNRHGVLHGLDCDYPTETNGLRAIALIDFFAWVGAVLHTTQI